MLSLNIQQSSKLKEEEEEEEERREMWKERERFRCLSSSNLQSLREQEEEHTTHNQ